MKTKLPSNSSAQEAAAWLDNFVKSDFQSRGSLSFKHDKTLFFLASSYTRAYNCFRSIRLISEELRYIEVLALARVLVSIAITSLWMSDTEDEMEKDIRFRLLHKKELIGWEKAHNISSESTGGSDERIKVVRKELELTTNLISENELWLAEHEVTRNPPDESEMARETGLQSAYDVVYRPGICSRREAVTRSMQASRSGLCFHRGVATPSRRRCRSARSGLAGPSAWCETRGRLRDPVFRD